MINSTDTYGFDEETTYKIDMSKIKSNADVIEALKILSELMLFKGGWINSRVIKKKISKDYFIIVK